MYPLQRESSQIAVGKHRHLQGSSNKHATRWQKLRSRWSIPLEQSASRTASAEHWTRRISMATKKVFVWVRLRRLINCFRASYNILLLLLLLLLLITIFFLVLPRRLFPVWNRAEEKKTLSYLSYKTEFSVHIYTQCSSYCLMCIWMHAEQALSCLLGVKSSYIYSRSHSVYRLLGVIAESQQTISEVDLYDIVPRTRDRDVSM